MLHANVSECAAFYFQDGVERVHKLYECNSLMENTPRDPEVRIVGSNVCPKDTTFSNEVAV